MKILISKIGEFYRKLKYLLRQYQYYFGIYEEPEIPSEFVYSPLLSILVPVYNTRLDHLKEMVDSVVSQSYTNWELILVDDASPDENPGNYLEERSKTDSRILYFRSDKNGGISLTTQKAFECSKGEYVAFLDHDDRLSKNALSIVVKTLQEEKNRPEFLYSDEIFQSKIPGIFSLSAKPEFSPEKLVSHNYICHFVVVSKNLIYRMGGIREGYDGSQDHEFALRASRFTDRIKRLPYFLYIWRLHGGSFSRKKAEICEASSQKAILEYYNDKKEEVEKIVPGNYPFTYHVLRKIKKRYIVSVIAWNRDDFNLEFFRENIGSLLSLPLEIKIELWLPEQNVLNQIPEKKNVILKYYKLLNSSSVSSELNRVVADVKGDFIFFWNLGLQPNNQNWLYELLQHAQFSEIGAVSPIVLNQKKELVYSSLILGKYGFIGKSGNNLTVSKTKIWSGEWVEKNVSAISGNCLLISKENWKLMNGLDESFQKYYWDIDLCLRLRKVGFRLVSNPFSEFVQTISDHNIFKELDPKYLESVNDRKRLITKWGAFLNVDDFYSSHSDLVGRDMIPKGLNHSFLEWYWKKNGLSNGKIF
ncbi:glycosyltransferase family 2 protein [Leptospira kirschneri]|uniref:Glycosyltransferase-like protein, family 2 n=1 Tax=Leptospira kirschneri serovar Bulgarica str. Nikolaevo TaxID=1240687 RepID=M6FDS0_9LEPT|nr:glycosyltransferase [Leptospira kirschneri]EMK25247.1 glycosyltransferase-like protein, family 2 [Leptospira kirschneri serovar Bulgarica str. Nikolaevo]